jgi:predicted Zn-dependent peptidase
MGLAFDEVDRTQWSHLIEHLVLRTTHPGQLTNANAETLPDHMRLDFYGTKDDWRDGLAHHAKWIASGTPFTDESVRVEPGRANSEVDHVVKAAATHKFGMAAWNQACRYGRRHVNVKGDLLNVDRAALEAYRDARLLVRERTLVCMIGGVEPEAVLAAAGEMFGSLKSTAALPKTEAIKPGEHRSTWDLDARHVILAWPIPAPDKDPKKHAAAHAFARLLWMQLMQDPAARDALGMLIVAADLHCPEGSYMYVSTPQRSDADWAAALKMIDGHVARLADANEPMLALPMIVAQLKSETDAQDSGMLRAQAPPHLKPGLIEAQCALTWGSSVYRLGPRRAEVINALGAVTAEQVRRAARDYVTNERRTMLELRPK